MSKLKIGQARCSKCGYMTTTKGILRHRCAEGEDKEQTAMQEAINYFKNLGPFKLTGIGTASLLEELFYPKDLQQLMLGRTAKPIKKPLPVPGRKNLKAGWIITTQMSKIKTPEEVCKDNGIVPDNYGYADCGAVKVSDVVRTVIEYHSQFAGKSHEPELVEILLQLSKAHNLLAKSEMPPEPYNAISKILAAVKLNLAEIINH